MLQLSSLLRRKVLGPAVYPLRSASMEDRMINVSVRLAAVLLLGAILSSCGTTTYTAAVRERDPNGRRLTTPVEIAHLPEKYPELKYLRDAAAFSAAVYVDVPVTTPLAEVKSSDTASQIGRASCRERV